MSLDGKRRERHTALAICRDVGKALHFCNSESPQWATLAERDNILQFLELLQARGMGPDGQLTKLERLVDAINYGQSRGDISEEEKGDVLRHITKWKRCLRTEKSKLNVERMEKASEMDMDIGSITTVVDNTRMWARVDDVTRRARKGRVVSSSDIKEVTAFLALAIKLKAYQR
jgi:hypothetical protein